MTKREKVYLERWIFILAIGLIFSALAGLNSIKADKSELKKVCDKQEKQDEILMEVRLEVKEIHTLLKEKLK